MLTVSAVSICYGSISAVDKVSFTVPDQAVVTMVGQNGAGKSSMVRAIAGLHPPTAGKIVFNGKDITRMPAYQIVRQGLAVVPEGRQLFGELTVEENLVLPLRLARKDRAKLNHFWQLFPNLAERRKRKAATLSGGEQQMLAIARALTTDPSLLILDEPSAGLSPVMILRLAETIRDLQKQGVAVLLVEQNIRFALWVADSALVFMAGRVIGNIPVGESTREIALDQITDMIFTGRPVAGG